MTRREGDVMTCCGRLFHTRDAATGNDRSPTVVWRVRRTTSIDDDAERSLHRATESAGRQSSSARYGGADPCTHFYTSRPTANLKSIRSFDFSQWSWRRSRVMRKKIRLARAVVGLTGRIETIVVLIPRSDRRSPVDAEEYHDRPCRRPSIGPAKQRFSYHAWFPR